MWTVILNLFQNPMNARDPERLQGDSAKACGSSLTTSRLIPVTLRLVLSLDPSTPLRSAQDDSAKACGSSLTTSYLIPHTSYLAPVTLSVLSAVGCCGVFPLGGVAENGFAGWSEGRCPALFSLKVKV